MTQEEIEALKKNLIPKCPENRNSEWLNMESRNPVPGDLVKLGCGGLVCLDEEVLIRVNTSQVNRAVRMNFSTGGGESNQVREHLLPSLAAKPARLEGRCSQSTLTRPPFSLQLDMGSSILKPGVLRTLKTEVEEFHVNSLLTHL